MQRAVWAQSGDGEISVVPAAGGGCSPCESKPQTQVRSPVPRQASEKSTPRPFCGVGAGVVVGRCLGFGSGTVT